MHYLRRVNSARYLGSVEVYGSRACIVRGFRTSMAVKPAVKWPLQMAVMDNVSWRFQSTFLIGLIGLSSKIFLGRCHVFIEIILSTSKIPSFEFTSK